MSSGEGTLSDREERLGEIVYACLRAAESGHPVDRSELLSRHPEFAHELTEFFAADQQFRGFAAPLLGGAHPTQLQAAGASPTPDQAGGQVPLPGPITGRRFGDYELLEEIGHGGNGVVYRARQVSLNRVVALKMLVAGKAASAADRQRFHNEAEAVANLDHPHIIPVYDHGEIEGCPFFSMKLVAGGSLDRLIPRGEWAVGTPETNGRAARLVATVARAVHHAHQHGLLHRDLKPSNILLDTDGAPYVTDFGLAKRVSGGPDLTQTGAIVGTPGYMAPEQVTGSKGAVTTATDVTGLGALLYVLLTGRPPYQGGTIFETLLQVQEREPDPPSRRNRFLGRDLETICLKCLHKDPGKRYGSAEALAEDLERWLAGEPIRARSVGRVERLARWCRRNPVLALLTVAALALLVTTVVVLAFSNVRITQEKQNAVESELRAKRRLFEAKRTEARASRSGRQPGRRHDGWQAVTEAAQLAGELGLGEKDLLALRNEGIGCLALTDVRPLARWEGMAPGSQAAPTFDAALARYARPDQQGGISIRQVSDDRELAALPGPGEAPGHMEFSPDGGLLAVQYNSVRPGDRNFRLWDWERKRVRIHPTFRVNAAGPAFSPDGRLLALGQPNGTLTVHDVASGDEVSRVGLGREILCLAFAPHGGQLAVAFVQGDIHLRELDTGKVVREFAVPATARGLAWHPDGAILAVACDDHNVYLEDVVTGEEHGVLKGHQGAAVWTAFSPDGDLVLSSGWDSTVRLWGPWTFQEVFRFPGAAGVFSRDGRRLATREGNNLALWEVTGAREYRALPRGRTPGREGLGRGGISPDGRWLAVGTPRGVRMWDLALNREAAFLSVPGMEDARFEPSGEAMLTSGKAFGQRWVLRAEASSLRVGPPAPLPVPWLAHRIALDREGRTLAVNLYHKVRLVDLKDPGRSPRVIAHGNVNSLALSPDGQWLATATHNGRGVKVWETATGKFLRDLAPEATLSEVAFSPDGRWLVTGTNTESGAAVWEVGSWERARTIARDQAGDNVAHAAFTADGAVLAVSVSPFALELIETSSWRVLARLESPDGEPNFPLSFTPDGGRLVVMAEVGNAWVWDVRRIRERLREVGLDWNPPALPAPDVRPVKVEVNLGLLDADPQRREDYLRAHEAKLGIRRFESPHSKWVVQVAVSGDGKRALSSSGDGTVRLWDVAAGKQVRSFEGHQSSSFGVAFSPDHRLIVSTGEHDGSVRLWDTESGKQVRQFAGHRDGVGGVAFAPDGKHILSGGADRMLRLWDVESGSEVRAFKGHMSKIRGVAFSPDGKKALSGSWEGDVRLWDVATGKELRRLDGHKEIVHRLAFSPDGLRALSGSADGTIRLWEVETGRELRRLLGHTGQVTGATFSPDGRHCLSCGYRGDGTVRLWALETGKEVARVEGIVDYTQDVAWAPDGRHALFAASDGIVRVWSLPLVDNP